MGNGRVYQKLADGSWKSRLGGSASGGVDPPPELPPLFPGHVPYRVLIGMNAPDDLSNPNTAPRPQYLEQESLIPGGLGYSRRMFSSNWYSTSKLNSMVNACEARNQLPVLTFKCPGDGSGGDDWPGVANGDYDSDLMALITWAKNKRVANGGNGKPILLSLHHEPNGNGPSGLSLLDQLTWWGRMQEHCLDFISGVIPGQPDDVTDIIAWAPIANGFWWGTKAPHPDRIAAALPGSYITKSNAKGGPILADMYDPAPNTWSRDALGNRVESSFTFNTNYDRCWRQIQTMVSWARSNNVKAIGFGETGNVLTANWDLMIDVIMSNRDIITVSNMFNNFANSKWDWRAIPANYPAYNGTNSQGLVDEGGDTLSAAYIQKFITLRDRSVAETAPF